MTRSVGEAAALGLDAGYRMATDAADRAERRRRQVEQDQLHLEDRQRLHGRQDRADQAAGLEGQLNALKTEGVSLRDNGATPQQQAEFASRVESATKARDELLARQSGYDFKKDHEAGLGDIKRLQDGNVDGVNLTRATVVSTGRSHKDYLRQGDQPSVVEQAMGDFMTGIENDDEQTLLRGVNTMYAPELRKGVGSKSKHGTIVAKQVIGLDKVPGGHPDDPRFVPRLRVFVNTGKELRGPLPEGMPEGANGYYESFLTRDRTSDPADPKYATDGPRAIGLKEAFDWKEKQLQVVELLNGPEAQQKLAMEAAEPGFDEQSYMKALTTIGAGKEKPVYKDTMVRGGATEPSYVARQQFDSKGNPVGAPKRVDIEGNSTAEKPKQAPKGAMAQKIAAIEAQGPEGSGRLSQAEVEKSVRDLTTKETTRAPRSSGGGGGGGGRGGGSNVQSKDVDQAGHVYYLTRDGKVAYPLVDGKRVTSIQHAKRIDKLAHDLSQGIGGLGKDGKSLREEARQTAMDGAEVVDNKPKGKAGGLSKDDAAKKFGF